MIVSASALTRNCGYVRKLEREKPRAAKLEEAAARGTAFHAAIERWIRDGFPPVLEDLEMQGWIDLLAAQTILPERAKTEIAWGISPDGAHVMVCEPKPHEYESMSGEPLLTAGRADAFWLTSTATRGTSWLTVVDWKTGRWPAPPAHENLQVNAAGLALAHRHGAQVYTPGIYYVRDGYWDWGPPVELGKPAAVAALEMVRAAAQLDETPRPGSWCASCWSRRDCHAAETP